MLQRVSLNIEDSIEQYEDPTAQKQSNMHYDTKSGIDVNMNKSLISNIHIHKLRA